MTTITHHHAYIIFSDPQTAKQLVHASVPEKTIIREYSYSLLGVEQVIDIQSSFQERQPETTWVVIYAERMSSEAQNKFLKTLEEPAPDLVFVIVLPKSVQVIPTVLSRVVVIRTDLSYDNLIFSVKDFLKKTITERIDMIDELNKKRKDEAFQPYEVQHFLDALESGFRMMFHKKPDVRFAEAFNAIRHARIWSKQTGVSQKHILDYIAISVDVL